MLRSSVFGRISKDRHPGLRGGHGEGVRVVSSWANVFWPLTRKIRFGAVDQDPVAHSSATEEHAKFHIFAVGETEFNLPLPFSNLQGCLDEGASFFMAAGVTNNPVIDHGSFGVAFNFIMSLNRVYREANPVLIVFLEDLVCSGMEAGGPGTAVDLRFDGGNGKVRQGQPFTPPDEDVLRCFCHRGLQFVRHVFALRVLRVGGK